jgi:hypothetical protein
LVVGEDAGESRLDFFTAGHHAAVKPDRLAIVGKQCRKRLRVSSIPCVEERAIQRFNATIGRSQHKDEFATKSTTTTKEKSALG